MRYKEISEDKNFLGQETEEQRYERLRALAIAKGYDLKGVGATPEEQIRVLKEPPVGRMLMTKANRHRLRAFLMGEDDGQ